jgi:hypothetical protein
MVANASGDHGDVVISRELLAELGEQVGSRLDSRVVVLIEDEQARTGSWRGQPGQARRT